MNKILAELRLSNGQRTHLLILADMVVKQESIYRLRVDHVVLLRLTPSTVVMIMMMVLMIIGVLIVQEK